MSSAMDNSALPPLPTDPAKLHELARMGQLTLQHLEELGAADKTPKPSQPKAPAIKAQDVGAVARRLGQVSLTILAVHRLAWQAVCDGDEDKQAALTLIAESMRGVGRALDACRQRLGGSRAGNFDDDMEGAP